MSDWISGQTGVQSRQEYHNNGTPCRRSLLDHCQGIQAWKLGDLRRIQVYCVFSSPKNVRNVYIYVCVCVCLSVCIYKFFFPFPCRGGEFLQDGYFQHRWRLLFKPNHHFCRPSQPKHYDENGRLSGLAYTAYNVLKGTYLSLGWLGDWFIWIIMRMLFTNFFLDP